VKTLQRTSACYFDRSFQWSAATSIVLMYGTAQVGICGYIHAVSAIPAEHFGCGISRLVADHAGFDGCGVGAETWLLKRIRNRNETCRAYLRQEKDHILPYLVPTHGVIALDQSD
jgi:hypothetical protein